MTGGLGGSGGTSDVSSQQNFAASSEHETGGSRQVEEERIPVIEEELRIGKREVERGGARVRSYVREVPVHEQVTLHQEHVSVERRPVNETLGREALAGNSDLLRDRTVEMVEHAEEAVVSKEAHVREEIVVKKTSEDRVEQIDDTVRRTEVDVEEGTAGMNRGSGSDTSGTSGSGDRSAFGSFGGGSDADRTGSSGTSLGGSSSEHQSEGSGYSPQIDKSGI